MSGARQVTAHREMIDETAVDELIAHPRRERKCINPPNDMAGCADLDVSTALRRVLSES